MPTYRYKCQKCGEEFDFEQRITDEPLGGHINSKGGYACGPVRRLIQRTHFLLKGGGWARDGYES